ncbi:hypothetical protein LG943_20420 [Streptomonospora sp. S1-112]|uniref:Uncharacterized protein n=1 Tax=Streptomonospora mangrovi TaxID=2883123 RepID=A0A9X3NNH7_9ACTN|nr:hypothetical protein [Streptomonospora mangrovi]MDA0566657.1 hypothetical protein [Streptomonospora mangrovi]
MTAEIPEGLADGIAPGAIEIPPVDLEKLETAAEAIKNDGQDIFDIGQDIKSDWAGLAAVYSAPEEDILFEAVDPVATKGTQVQSASAVAGDALLTFAEEVRPILERWKSLKADAAAMQRHIADNAEWDKDEAKVEEFNTLNNDLIKVQNDFMAAERDCANKITALFGGTTFVAVEPGTDPDLGPNTQAYGYTEAPRDVATPWAIPQQHDAAWYVDVGAAVGDFAWAFVTDPASSIGAYNPATETWTADADQMMANAAEFWHGTAVGAMSLMGVSVENGLSFQSLEATGAAWADMAHAFFPWTELEDRPGYAGTTAGLNITADVIAVASIASGVGAPVGMALLARKGFGALRNLNSVGDGPRAGGPDIGGRWPDLDFEAPGPRTGAGSGAGMDSTPELEMPTSGNGLPTARELQRFLDTTELYANNEQHPDIPQNTPEAARPATREPALVGAPEYDIQANADDPDTTHRARNDIEDTPNQTEPPRQDPASRPTNASGGITTGSGGGPPSPTVSGLPDVSSDENGEDGEAPDPEQRSQDGFRVEGTADGDDDPENAPEETPVESSGPPVAEQVANPAVVPDAQRVYFDWDSAEKGYEPGLGPRIRDGYTDGAGRYRDQHGNVFLDGPDTLGALRDYENIRGMANDVNILSERSGISFDMIDRVKKHLFYKVHVVETGVGEVREGLFSPNGDVSAVWMRMLDGDKYRDKDVYNFRRMVMHEWVEAFLMENGLPYRSSHPEYFSTGSGVPTPEHYGAHDLAPNQIPSLRPFGHYYRMGRSEPDFDVHDDLRGLPEFAQNLLDEWNDR